MSLEPAIRDAMLAAIPSLRAFARSLCRNVDQADDLVQETLLRACAAIHSFKFGTNMSAWLFTILRNHFYSEWRRRRIRPEAIDQHAAMLATRPTQIVQAEYANFSRAFAKLSPNHREALFLVGASGLTYEEAGRVCGCPSVTIKSRVNRARADLAQLMEIEAAGDFADDPITSSVIAATGRSRIVV